MGKFRADLSFKRGKRIAPITSGHAGSPQLSVLATGGRSRGQGKCRGQCWAHSSSLGNVPKGAGCVTGAEPATAGTSRPPVAGL